MNCIVLLLLLSCCCGRGNGSRGGMCGDCGCGRRLGEGRERDCGCGHEGRGGHGHEGRNFDGRPGDCGCGERDGDGRGMSGMVPPPWQDYPKFPRRDGGSDCEACEAQPASEEDS